MAANLISFIAFIYFLDGVLSWMGGLVGWDFITFEVINLIERKMFVVMK